MAVAPTNLSVIETNPGSVQLSWDWAGDTNNHSFLVECSSNSTAGFVQVGVAEPGGVTASGTYTFTYTQGLNVTKYYRVRSSDIVDQTPSSYTSVVAILTQGNVSTVKLKFLACLSVCCEKVVFRDLTGLAPNPDTGYVSGTVATLSGTLRLIDINGTSVASWTVTPSSSPAFFQELALSAKDGLYQLEYSVTDNASLNLLAKEFIFIDCNIKDLIKCIVPGYIDGDSNKEDVLQKISPMLYGVLPSQISNGQWDKANRTIAHITKHLKCAC